MHNQYYFKYIKYKNKYIKLRNALFNPNLAIRKLINTNISILNTNIRKLTDNEIDFAIIDDKTIKNNKINNGVWTDLPNELYIIGDIHGDFYALKQSLELTGCVEFDKYDQNLDFNNDTKLFTLKDGCQYYSIENNNVRWNKNKINSFIVIAGDIIDRCRPCRSLNPKCINTINDENCDYQMFKLLLDLNKDAMNYGSRIIIVLGNHEILNLNNDLRYVSNKGIKDETRLTKLKTLIYDNILNIYGIVRINRYIIVHGGINDIFFENVNRIFNNKLENNTTETIEIYNEYLRNSLLGLSNSTTLNNLEDISPVWDRTIGGFKSLNSNQCKKIFIDNILNIKPYNNNHHLKIIVAHCPQFIEFKNINLCNCDEFENRIYRIDIGMSIAFDSYKINNELNNLLDKINTDNILQIEPTEFLNYNKDDSKTRVVSILQIDKHTEKTLNGKLSIKYFYDTAFKNDKDKYRYLLSDLKKIITANLKIALTAEKIYILNKSLVKINILLDYLINNKINNIFDFIANKLFS